jgi:hypothetical protein
MLELKSTLLSTSICFVICFTSILDKTKAAL